MYKLVETQSNAPSYTLMKAGVNENVSLVDVTFDTLRKDGTGGIVLDFISKMKAVPNSHKHTWR